MFQTIATTDPYVTRSYERPNARFDSRFIAARTRGRRRARRRRHRALAAPAPPRWPARARRPHPARSASPARAHPRIRERSPPPSVGTEPSSTSGVTRAGDTDFDAESEIDFAPDAATRRNRSLQSARPGARWRARRGPSSRPELVHQRAKHGVLVDAPRIRGDGDATAARRRERGVGGSRTRRGSRAVIRARRAALFAQPPQPPALVAFGARLAVALALLRLLRLFLASASSAGAEGPGRSGGVGRDRRGIPPDARRRQPEGPRAPPS